VGISPTEKERRDQTGETIMTSRIPHTQAFARQIESAPGISGPGPA